MPLFAFLLTKPGCHSHVLTSCIFSQVPSAILNLTWNEEVRTQIYDQQGIDLSLNDDWHSFVVLRFRQCAVVVIISRHPHFVKPSLSIGLFPPQQKVSEPSNLLETLESKHRSTLNVFVFFFKYAAWNLIYSLPLTSVLQLLCWHMRWMYLQDIIQFQTLCIAFAGGLFNCIFACNLRES